MSRPGALAERFVVPSRFAWRVDGLDPTVLVCIEPLTSSGRLRRMSRELPNAALVVGAGPQGLLMCLALMMRGVEVHISDTNGERLAFAGRLGAKIEPVDRPFDFVVDSVGSPAANDWRWRIALRPARSWFSAWMWPLGLSARTLVRRQLELRGSLTYDHPVDFRHTIELVSGAKLDPGRIVQNEFALDDVKQAMEAAPQRPGRTRVKITAL